MHKGPIKLGVQIQQRCLSLVNLGNIMQLFTIRLFVRAMEVSDRLVENQLFLHDIQDLVLLGSAIKESDMINEHLREDIGLLLEILDLYIQVSSQPTRPCGMLSLAEK